MLPNIGVLISLKKSHVGRAPTFYSITSSVILFYFVVAALSNIVYLMQSGGIRVHGRKLFIVAAVTREDAAKLKENKKKVESGTRNLYLAREGCK